MLKTSVSTDVAKLPLAPKNPLPYRDQLRAVRSLIDGHQELLDAGGPVTRIVLAFPQAVLIASPQGARDVLGRTDARGQAQLGVHVGQVSLHGAG